LSIATLSCGRDKADTATLGQVRQGLSAAAQRVLSFETPSADWQSSSGSVGISSQHADGAASLAVSGGGYRELRSIALASLGQVAEALTLDVQIPSPDPNPWWRGSVNVVVEVPSQGPSAKSRWRAPSAPSSV
jgi:hypothetical protein